MARSLSQCKRAPSQWLRQRTLPLTNCAALHATRWKQSLEQRFLGEQLARCKLDMRVLDWLTCLAIEQSVRCCLPPAFEVLEGQSDDERRSLDKVKRKMSNLAALLKLKKRRRNVQQQQRRPAAKFKVREGARGTQERPDLLL